MNRDGREGEGRHLDMNHGTQAQPSGSCHQGSEEKIEAVRESKKCYYFFLNTSNILVMIDPSNANSAL